MLEIFQKFIGRLFWGITALLAASFSFSCGVIVYYYFYPPRLSQHLYLDPYIGVYQTVTIGSITLDDIQIPIVFCTLCLASLGAAYFAIQNFFERREQDR